MVRRVPALLALVWLQDLAEVELRDDIQDEVGEVVLGQPLQRRRRQQETLARRVRSERLHRADRRSRRRAQVHGAQRRSPFDYGPRRGPTLRANGAGTVRLLRQAPSRRLAAAE